MLDFLLSIGVIIAVLFFFAEYTRKKTMKTSHPPPYPDWSIETTRPLPYRPFRYGPHYIVRMGAKSLNLDNWIELDNQWTQYHNEKLTRLAGELSPRLLKTSSEAFDAALETMELLSEYVVYRYPSLFEYLFNSDGEKYIRIKTTGEVYPIKSDNPLKYASLLIQDDMAIMIEGVDDGQYYLKAGAIVIPGLWRLEDKFNKSLADIHLSGNVPQYAEKLHHSMDKFFQKMSPESPIYRFAYFIQTDGALAWSAIMGPEETYGEERYDNIAKPMLSIEQIHLRTERQTLRRLPRSGAILFTLHPYVTPIVEIAKEPGVAGRLASAIRSWTEDADEYRRSENYKDIVLKYLDEKHQEQCDQGVKIDTSDSYPY